MVTGLNYSFDWFEKIVAITVTTTWHCLNLCNNFATTISKRSFHCKCWGLGYYPSLSQMLGHTLFCKQKNRWKMIFDSSFGKLFSFFSFFGRHFLLFFFLTPGRAMFTNVNHLFDHFWCLYIYFQLNPFWRYKPLSVKILWEIP